MHQEFNDQLGGENRICVCLHRENKDSRTCSSFIYGWNVSDPATQTRILDV